MEWQRGQSDALGRNPIFIGGHGGYRIPEAFKAFCIIVSFTAAKTSRIFVVSVACVRLQKGQGTKLDHEQEANSRGVEEDALWVNVEPGSICLHELEQDEFGSLVHVWTADVLRTVPLQWDLHWAESVGRTNAKICGTFGILFRNTSILFMKRIIDVRKNHLELTMDSKSTSDSVIRF